MKGAALTGVDVRQFMLFEPERAASHLAELLGAVALGRIAPPVGRIFALDDFAPALEFALTGKGLGKTVLRLADD
jgi:NADPH2:quinone reductase